jgi:HTH-type transcriptional regulator/antitoxin HigA
MNNLAPNWASPPGDTIKDILGDLKISTGDFFERLGLGRENGEKLLDGTAGIDHSLADQLSITIGASPKFWMNRENQYREDSIRVEESNIERYWMEKLPLKDMVGNKWISPNLRGQNKSSACLKYFGVNTFTELAQKYDNTLHTVAFRISESFDSNPESIITWLRQGEIQSEELNLVQFDVHKLNSSLPEVRKLTTEPFLHIFLPKLKEIFSKCGVVLAISPTPKGCSASGAVYFLDDGRAVILLSVRYLSDDHFWFTLFHECAHLILHQNQGLMLEGVSSVTADLENEANSFAENILVPAKYKDELNSLTMKNLRGILKFAKKVGISKGIIIGQLQHKGIISYRTLNRLKTRYRWT